MNYGTALRGHSTCRGGQEPAACSAPALRCAAFCSRRRSPPFQPLQSRSRRRATVLVRAEVWSPPAVADTKRKFYENFPFPIPGMYNNVIQELLVQQHIVRWNKSYSYDEVFALGFVSVFDQVLGGLPEDVQKSVFTAYISALEEDASKFRSDAAKMESLASGLASPAELKPDENGSELQQLLAGIAGRVANKKFLYTKLFAIGVFRLLELTGAKEPKALETLVKSLGISMDSVNRDLMTYKATLSKLSAARELMKEMFDRDRQKALEREKEKAEKAAATEAKAATEEEAGVRSSS